MTESREAYQTAIREAHELAWALKWEAASQKYREALAIVPNDPTARVSLGLALTRTGRLAEALAEYQAAREFLPNDTLLLSRIAELNLRTGQREAAAAAFAGLAGAYHAQGEAARASAACRQALEQAAGSRRALRAVRERLAPSGATALLALADEALARAGPDDAPAAPAPAPRVEPVAPPAPVPVNGGQSPRLGPPPAPEPDDPARRLAAAERHARAGQLGQAVDDYLTAAERLADPAAARAARSAAAGLARDWLIGELDEAAELPASARRIALDAMAASHACLRHGLLIGALDESLRAIAFAPDYLPAQLRLAAIYRQAGLRDEARRQAQDVAELYTLRGEPARSAAALRELVRLEPDQPAAWQRLVDRLLGLDQPASAADVLDEWAGHLAATGDPAGALERRRAAAKLSGSLEHWHALGRALEAAGESAEALAALDAAAQLAPAAPDLALARARCQALLGRWPAAEASLDGALAGLRADSSPMAAVLADCEAALARAPGSPALLYVLGLVLRAAGRSDEARAALAAATSDDGRPGRLARFHLGRWELDAGEVAAAIAWLSAVDAPPAEDEAGRALALDAYRLLATACPQVEDWGGLARALAALLAVTPDDAALHLALAEAHFRAGQGAGALATFERLARLYLARGERERALATYEGMTQLAPADAALWETLAQLYQEAGQAEEALGALLEAADRQQEQRCPQAARADLLVALQLARSLGPGRTLAVRQRLAAVSPDDLESRRELIHAYVQAGRPAQALAEARSAVERFLRAGRTSDALVLLRLAVQLDPWNTSLQALLARLQAQPDRAPRSAPPVAAAASERPPVSRPPALSGELRGPGQGGGGGATG